MAPNMFSWFTIVITSCQLGSRTLTLDSAKQYQFQIFESSIAKNTKKGVLDDMITNNIPAIGLHILKWQPGGAKAIIWQYGLW